MAKRLVPSEEALKFAVDSQLLGELGEKLVTKNYVALSELVKNAYDADATRVIMRFTNTRLGGPVDNTGEIQITDNGCGMSFEQVQAAWMRIATTHKVDKPISEKFGRPRTGNKGIGRFACQRLSRHLTLRATARVGAHQFQTTVVNFDWTTFVPGTDLTEIPCQYETTFSSTGKPGVTLTLRDLREDWLEQEFNMLRRQIVMLTVQEGARRKGFEEDPGFEIKLDAPEFPGGVGILIDQLMNAGWGMLRGQVDHDGSASLSLEAKVIGTKSFVLTEQYDRLRGIHFEIAFVPGDKKYFRNTKALTKNVAQTLRQFGGVRLYMEGFRVYPYGDPGDDWLGIDRDVARRKGTVDDKVLQGLAIALKLDASRVLLLYPRHQSLIGRVHISTSKESPFVVKMDREGLVENDAYRRLVEFLRISLDWMTLWYAVFLRRFSRERRRQVEQKFLDSTGEKIGDPTKVLHSALDVLVDRATTESKAGHKQADTTVVRQAREVIEARVDEAQAELALLRAVASTGPLVFAFAHEVKGTIGTLDTNAGSIESISRSVKGGLRTQLHELASSLREASHRFGQITRLFGVFSTAQTLSKKRIPVCKALRLVVEGFGFVLDEFKMSVDLKSIDEATKTRLMTEAEFLSIAVNLLSNAIKASIASQGKQIRIEALRNGDLKLRFLDRGVGLSKNRWEDVFEPLNADPEDRIYKQLSVKVGDTELATLGRGTGLGLSIVRGIVESHRGSVKFVKPPSNWKACIEVTLP